MSHDLTHIAADAAKNAARTLAQAFDADPGEMREEDVAALSAEVRELLNSTRVILRGLELASPEPDTARDLRDARYSTEEAVRVLENSYPTESYPAHGDKFTPITTATEIRALSHGQELNVGGVLFRICKDAGEPTLLLNLTTFDYGNPDDLIEECGHTQTAILLRHQG